MDDEEFMERLVRLETIVENLTRLDAKVEELRDYQRKSQGVLLAVMVLVNIAVPVILKWV